MKLFLKILKWVALITTAMLIILFCVSSLLQDDVAAIFLRSINKQIETKIEAGSLKLSLIRKFPKASLELENFLVRSSPEYDTSQFNVYNTDTLLLAKSLSMQFRVTDLIKGIYNIESVDVKHGVFNLFTDSSGMVNYEISSASTSRPDNEILLNLESVNISDLNFMYFNTATRLKINGLIKNGRLKSRIAGNNIDFSANSTLQIISFDLYSTHLKTNSYAELNINLHKSDSGILFDKSSLKLDNFNFGLSGFITANNILYLKVTGQNIEISRLKNYLPEKYQVHFKEYNPSGKLKTDTRITGKVTRTDNPDIMLSYSLENGHIYYKKSNISINKLSFTGYYTNGKPNHPRSSQLIVDNLKATMGSADFSGSFSLSDFSHPKIDLTFSGDIFPGELREFLNIPELKRAEGCLRLNLHLSGGLKKKDRYNLSDIIDLNPEADILFNSLSFGLRKNALSFEDIDGNIMVAKHIWTNDLFLTYKGQRFRINGEFGNLPAWLAGRPVRIKASADVSVSNLMPELFIPDTSIVAPEKKSSFQLPGGAYFEILFKIDNLSYKSFSSSNISGILSYAPGVANFRSIKFNSQKGTITGDFLFAQSPGKSFIFKGGFNLNDIDVNDAFRSFNNFGQGFLKAENIAGSLTGNLSLLMSLDSLFKPDIKSITAEGRYSLMNGALINFDPVKKLSRFIELSELENITFSRLENDFFIKSNYLAIPQMDIKSSAVDLMVNGKHYFDSNYEYHVKMYLSDILSRKAKSSGLHKEEFGAVEEDGPGRTSLFLKITGNREDVKVGYDIKAASGSVKQNLRSEKENLKSILNQEYGWFSKDSLLKNDPAPKPKFRIEWEEADSVMTQPDSSEAEKEKGIINRIFKKKKI